MARKKVNRNKIILDFKCANCDYTMRESHNILESTALNIMNILDSWKELIIEHMSECAVLTSVGIPDSILDIPISELIPNSQEGS